jgi:hypothetical protein
MSDPSAGAPVARPRPVTVAGVIAVTTCALMVLLLFDYQNQLRTVEMRQDISHTLRTHGWVGLVTVAQVLAVVRGVIFVSAGLSAAGLVLAVYSLRRHRAARIGLSIVAGALLFTATLVTGPLPLVVVLAAARLWRRDARAWFDAAASG